MQSKCIPPTFRTHLDTKSQHCMIPGVVWYPVWYDTRCGMIPGVVW